MDKWARMGEDELTQDNTVENMMEIQWKYSGNTVENMVEIQWKMSARMGERIIKA